ncbi:hypothetical protein EDD11_002812 [Mortierella claussenii]|nr:hypothetical protein EDD11_002812 [Mortierella claussenii]
MSSTIGLRRLRIWLIILSFLTVAMMIACYIRYAASWDYHVILPWQDIILIILTVLLFFSYIYSVKGKSRLHKGIRAFLMLFLCTFLLGLQSKSISLEVDYSNTPYAKEYGYKAFQCFPYYDYCYMCWSFTFLSMLVSIFGIVDVAWTLKAGPLDPAQLHRYGRHGYNAQANVVVVSPEQQQHQLLPQQGSYQGQLNPYQYQYQQPQQPFQQQPFQQQPSEQQPPPMGYASTHQIPFQQQPLFHPQQPSMPQPQQQQVQTPQMPGTSTPIVASGEWVQRTEETPV